MKSFLKVVFFVLFAGSFTSCELFEDGTVTLPLTEAEIVQGLKEALSIGLTTSVDDASSVNGYLQNEVIKILLPEEVVALQSTINNDAVVSTIYNGYVNTFNGGSDIFEELILAMNEGAENAASKAGPIFGNAITGMSFDDARGILNGGESAATDFFYEETSQDLFVAFQPDVVNALEGTGANDLYELAYNFINEDVKVLGVTVGTVGNYLNVSLENETLYDYATNQAIDGLFYLVGEEEKKIREDPFAWGSAIIERVFGNQ